MARLAVRLLGPLQVTLDGDPVTGFESDKVRALLAYLAVEADRPQRRERLAGLLWPDRPEQVARANLRVALVNLRSVIGDRRAEPAFLCITSQAIQLNPVGDAWVDAATFSTLVETRAIPSLEEAVELYGGDFLEGFSLPGSAAFEEWVVLTRERLARQVLQTLQQVARHHENHGAYERALHYARRQITLDPWGERAQRRVLRLLARTGQRNAALAHYDSLCQTLAQDLGVEPEDKTVALYRRIRAGAAGERPAVKPPHNLPAALTPFVGRRAELAAIAARLRDPACRLLTLVGPGGSGKTRLALETARRLLDEAHTLAHGLYFVALASLQSLADVVAAVAEALVLPLGGKLPPERQVIDYLRAKQVLLLLDNLEHLLSLPTPATDEILDWLVALLQAAPGVHLLVTSRLRLNLQAEHLFPVAGLALPEATVRVEDLIGYDGVALFCDGARRVRPDFELAAGNAADVVRICRAVDGLPLAILLAATGVETLPTSEIARRLAGEGEPGVDLLTASWHDLPRRQRSMRAVFDHSWQLLTGAEQATLPGLSVFCGGFGRQAAAEVVGASSSGLESLAHKSLLIRAPAGRYGMHELLRQYLSGRLAEVPAAGEAVGDRHSAYFARALGRWANELKGEGQEGALAEMDADIQNAQAAWVWLVEQGQIEQLAGAAEGLCLFFEWRARYRQGEAACRQATERLAGQASLAGRELRLLAYLLAWQSLFVHHREGSQQARPLLDRSLALLDDPRLAGQDSRRERAHAWWCQGRLLVSRDREGARLAYTHCLALYRDLGDRWGQANALAALGGVAWNLGDYRDARRRHEASLAMRQVLGDKRGIATALMAVGVTALHQGEVATALPLVQRGCDLRQALGDRRGHADGLRHLGVTHLLLGEFGQAASLLEASLAIYDDLGLRFGLEVAMLADALLHDGKDEAGQARAAEALAIARGTGYRRGIGYALLVLGEAALLRDANQEATAHLAESIAVYREIDQWDEGCRALATLAYARRGLGYQPWLPAGLADELQIAVERQAFLPLLWALPVLALLLADAGQSAPAAELYALALGYPAIARSRWFASVVGRHFPDVAAVPASIAQGQTLPAIVADVLASL